MLDAARLLRPALEKGLPGARYHGVSEEGIPLRDVAEVLGKRLQLPVGSKSADHFGFLKPFISLDSPASSNITQKQLGWNPVETTLLSDLEQMHLMGT